MATFSYNTSTSFNQMSSLINAPEEFANLNYYSIIVASTVDEYSTCHKALHNECWVHRWMFTDTHFNTSLVDQIFRNCENIKCQSIGAARRRQSRVKRLEGIGRSKLKDARDRAPFVLCSGNRRSRGRSSRRRRIARFKERLGRRASRRVEARRFESPSRSESTE